MRGVVCEVHSAIDVAHGIGERSATGDNQHMLNELSAVSTASGEKPRSASRVGIRGSDPS